MGDAFQKAFKYCTASLLIIVLMMSLFAFTLSAAEPNAGANSQADVLRVGFFELDGFNNVAEDGTLSGYGYESLMEIAKYTGWNYEFVTKVPDEKGEDGPLTYDESLVMLAQGKLDIVGTVLQTPEREGKYAFPALGSGTSYGLLTAPSTNVTYTAEHPATLRDCRVGLVRASACNADIHAWVNEHQVEGVTYWEFDTSEAVTRALERGMIDAAYVTSLRKVRNERVLLRQNPRNFYFILAPDDVAHLAQINRAQESVVIQTPYFSSELMKKYYGDSVGTSLILTEEEKAYIRKNPVVRVALYDNYFPFEVKDDRTGQYAGTSVDLLNMISGRTGLQFELKPKADEEYVAQDMQSGRVQAMTAMVHDYTWAAQHAVRLTGTYLDIPVSAVINSGVGDYTNPNTRIAAVKGYYITKSAVQQYGYTHILYYNCIEDCIDAVNKGRADVTFLPTYTVGHFDNLSYYQHFYTISDNALNCKLSLGVSTNENFVLYQILNKAVASISEKEMSDSLYNHMLFNQENTSLRTLLYRYPTVVVTVCLVAVLLTVLVAVIVVRSRMRAAKEQGVSEQRLQLALAQTNINIWDYDVQKHTLYQTEANALETGMGTEVERVPESLIACGYIHPESSEAFRQMFREIDSGQATARATVRVRVPGRERYYWKRIKMTALKGGWHARVLGVSENITDTMTAQHELHKVTQFHDATRADTVASCEIDVTAGRLLEDQPMQWGELGIPATASVDSLLNAIADKAVHPEDQDAFWTVLNRTALIRAMAAGEHQVTVHVRMATSANKGQKERAYEIMDITCYLILDTSSGHVLGSLMLRNATERQRREYELEEKASTDALTGLLNREAFLRGADEKLLKKAGEQAQSALLMLDMDHFKSANDTRGHAFGDRLLCEVAQRLHRSIRLGDLVGRLGGDEFVVLLCGMKSVDEAQRRAEAIVTDMCFSLEGYVNSCSMGIAMAPEHGRNFETLYHHADEALYAAKNAGKGCCCLYCTKKAKNAVAQAPHAEEGNNT